MVMVVMVTVMIIVVMVIVMKVVVVVMIMKQVYSYYPASFGHCSLWAMLRCLFLFCLFYIYSLFPIVLGSDVLI